MEKGRGGIVFREKGRGGGGWRRRGGPVSLLPPSILNYVVLLQLRASSNTLISLHEFNCACMSASMFCCVNLSCLFFHSQSITAAAAAGNTVHLRVNSSSFIFFFFFHLFIYLLKNVHGSAHHTASRRSLTASAYLYTSLISFGEISRMLLEIPFHFFIGICDLIQQT